MTGGSDPAPPASGSPDLRSPDFKGGPLRAALSGLHLARPVRTAVAVASHPDLWRTAIRLVLRTAAPGWWRHVPATPAPSLEYVAFRTDTMLGAGGQRRLTPGEVVAFLQWCKRMRAIGG
ncbi:MAG: hypothetical protein M3063_03140 [Actinomycetota bacterium]|nr:hypothetical protein [Actinomycetota bacterium]